MLVALSIIITTAACLADAEAQSSKDKLSVGPLERLEALAKLYGIVRWFHPSETAECIGWHEFLTHAVSDITQPGINRTDQEMFDALFAPVTQNMIFQNEQRHIETFLNNKPEILFEGVPESTYWQHLGFGTDISPLPYKSARVGLNLYQEIKDAVFQQQVSRQKTIAADIQFRATFESSGDRDICGNLPHVSLFARSMDANGRLLSIESSTIEVAAEPTDIQIDFKPPKPTVSVSLGGVFRGRGRVYVSSLGLEELKDEGAREVLPLINKTFSKTGSERALKGWDLSGDAYHFETAISPSSGLPALLIQDAQSERLVEPMFPEAPAPHSYTAQQLNRQLTAIIPASLPITALTKDWDALSTEVQNRRLRLLDSVSDQSKKSDIKVLALASVIEAWNLLQHSYPYWDTISVDWEDTLREALSEAYRIQSFDELWWLLRSMIAKAGDGHANVFHNSQSGFSALPFHVEVLDGIPYVASRPSPQLDTAGCVVPGDKLIKVNGKVAKKQVRVLQRFVGGSAQFKEHIAANELLGRSKRGASIDLVVTNPNGRRKSCTAVSGNRPDSRWGYQAVEILNDDTVFMDLSRLTYEEFLDQTSSLESMETIIFDLRSYTSTGFRLLGHFTRAPFEHGLYRTPRIIYPNMSEDNTMVDGTIKIEPAEPYLGNKSVVFIVGPHTISATETLLEIADGLKIGSVVGTPTAGVTGNINRARLPGGFTIVWTGMRYERQTGGMIHGRGVQPDVVIDIERSALIRNRDVALEVAKESE